MKRHCDEFRRLGCEPLAISFGTKEAVAVFLEEYPLPFRMVSDASRAAYQAFGLERTTWGRIFRGGVLGRYLGLMLRGWLPRKPREQEDVLQLGGDFVLDAAHRLVYAHPSTEPTDRPSIGELLRAVQHAIEDLKHE